MPWVCNLGAVASPLDQSAPTVRARRDEARRSQRRAWFPLILVLLCTTAYGLFFVLPYYVNDLDQFPLEEVASGAHDPKDLWPYEAGGVLGAIWAYGALSSCSCSDSSLRSGQRCGLRSSCGVIGAYSGCANGVLWRWPCFAGSHFLRDSARRSEHR